MTFPGTCGRSRPWSWARRPDRSRRAAPGCGRRAWSSEPSGRRSWQARQSWTGPSWPPLGDTCPLAHHRYPHHLTITIINHSVRNFKCVADWIFQSQISHVCLCLETAVSLLLWSDFAALHSFNSNMLLNKFKLNGVFSWHHDQAVARRLPIAENVCRSRVFFFKIFFASNGKNN